MKNVNTKSIELQNGNILIGVDRKGEYRRFYVKTSNGIFVYSEEEMEEIYRLVPADTDLIGTV